MYTDRPASDCTGIAASARCPSSVVRVSRVDRDALLALFDELVTEIRQSLSGLDDWGPSGERASQYRHDIVADNIVVPRLRSAGLRVLSEESGLVGTGEVTVVVDPVDGSTNGARRLPWYATSLCAVDDDGPVAALVANLASGDRYRASRGEGVEMGGIGGVDVGAGSDVGVDAGVDVEGGADGGADPVKPVGYRALPFGPSGCERLEDAVVGFSGLPPTHGGWSQFRALGAAALDLCAVATGSLDGFVDIDRAHGVWDYLGGLLVCREAGAVVVDGGGDGAELITLDPSARRAPVAAATPALLEDLLAMVAAWRGEGGR